MVWAGALLVVGALIGYGLSLVFPSYAPSQFISREGGYEFVNPLLSCDISEDTPYANFDKLKSQFEKTIAASKASGSVKRVSVYFRDLDRGRWTGVNVDDTYIPASLNKMAPFIGWLRDTPSTDLSRVMLTIPEAAKESEVQHYPPEKPLAAGTTYSLETLLKSMIQESDNNAAFTLYDALATSTLNNVYESFSIPSAETPNEELMSPKIYSRFFRILYNASYLGRTKSQLALKMLAQTTFAEGITAGVPGSIVVSHKFGERTVLDGNGAQVKVELHDCGIIYYPRIPYMLCVMTEGADFPSLEKAIRDISRAAFQSVQSGLIAPYISGE